VPILDTIHLGIRNADDIPLFLDTVHFGIWDADDIVLILDTIHLGIWDADDIVLILDTIHLGIWDADDIVLILDNIYLGIWNADDSIRNADDIALILDIRAGKKFDVINLDTRGGKTIDVLRLATKRSTRIHCYRCCEWWCREINATFLRIVLRCVGSPRGHELGLLKHVISWLDLTNFQQPGVQHSSQPPLLTDLLWITLRFSLVLENSVCQLNKFRRFERLSTNWMPSWFNAWKSGVESSGFAQKLRTLLIIVFGNYWYVLLPFTYFRG